VTLNGDVFQIDWDDIQQRVTLPSCGLGYTGNAGRARIRGFELEFNARPVDGLSLGAAVGYNHARITQAGSGTVQQVGDRLQQVPDWNLAGNIEYEGLVSGAWRGFGRLDVTYTSSSLSANNSPTNPRVRPDYTLVDVRLGVRQDQYEVTAFARNLTNEHANLSDNVSIGAEYPGRPRIVTNRPRTIGVESRIRF
jgi:outer membrane receptor protein involved in Fe transport